ncbi:MAG: ABC transporter permease [Rhodocyclaceae bacterium]
MSLVHDAQLAARNLTRSPGRTSLAAVTIVCGIAAYVLAVGFIDWIFVAMRDSVIYSNLGHFQITRGAYLEKGLADPYRYLIAPDDKALDGVRRQPGLETLAPRLAVSGLISVGEQSAGFLGEGIDPVREASIGRELNILQGRRLTQANEPAVIVGEGLAAAIGARVGQRVVLLAHTASGSQNAVECTVVGIFSTSTKAYDDAYLRLPLAIAQQLVRTQGATSYVGLLDDTDATDAFVAALRTPLKDAGLTITPWHAQADFYTKTVALFSRQLAVIRAIIALIILLSIANTLSMSVAERTSEIGTTLAVGTRRRDVLRLFLVEGVLLGVVGGVVGIALAAALAALLSQIGIPMPPPPGMAHGFIGQIRFSWGVALDALLLAMLTTLIASVLPAWRASRMNIVNALRAGR